jgi:hypothetical protein
VCSWLLTLATVAGAAVAISVALLSSASARSVSAPIRPPSSAPSGSACPLSSRYRTAFDVAARETVSYVANVTRRWRSLRGCR